MRKTNLTEVKGREEKKEGNYKKTKGDKRSEGKRREKETKGTEEYKEQIKGK